MNLDRSLEIFEVVTKAWSEGFLRFDNSFISGKLIQLSNSKFTELSDEQEVFVVEDYDNRFEKHIFEYKDHEFFTLIEKEPVASNPYGLTEQERDMRQTGHKESDFFE